MVFAILLSHKLMTIGCANATHSPSNRDGSHRLQRSLIIFFACNGAETGLTVGALEMAFSFTLTG